MFYNGLREDLKDISAQIVDPPKTCPELIELVVKLEHRVLERKRRRNMSDMKVLTFPESASSKGLKLKNLCRLGEYLVLSREDRRKKTRF